MSAYLKGDSIIEVLLAFSVFSLVSVATMTIMGQGSNSAQRALEITLVRQQIDSQAEAIRAAQRADSRLQPGIDTAWQQIALPSSDDTDPVDVDASCPETVPNRSFLMDARDASIVPSGWWQAMNSADAPPYAQVQYDGGVKSYGIWVERKFQAGASGAPDAYNFTIHGCWFGAGVQAPLHIQTVVRLYDPTS